MGFRSWFRKFVSKVKDLLGIYDKYNDFRAEAIFPDGGEMVYEGKPWGPHFEAFKKLAGEEAVSMRMNMTGGFWEY